MKKRLLAALLALTMVCALLPATALAADSDFVIENGVLKKYTGPGGDVVVPDGVTAIGDGAFAGCTGLTDVTIPGSVTYIGPFAFSSCTNLTSVTIPEGVTSIGESAFGSCTGLTNVTIPDSVTSIGYMAFSGTSLTSVTIPANVTSIGGYAFDECTSLASVAIPTSVTSIGAGAFRKCWSLTSVTIPEGVTAIGYAAFSNCTSLTDVTIPTSVTNMDKSAFFGTPWWRGLEGEFVTINGILLDYRGKGGKVVIPESVTSIGDRAFESKNLTSVVIHEGVTTIGEETFRGCTSLTSVTMQKGVTSIGSWAFYYCYSLTSVTIPASVTTIGAGAFGGCPDLAVYGRVGSYAEQYCTILEIPFASFIIDQGMLTDKSGRELEWDISMTGEVTITGALAPEEKILVACYDNNGRFTGVKLIDTQHAATQIDPKTPNVKLFWLNGSQSPLSACATVWGE